MLLLLSVVCHCAILRLGDALGAEISSFGDQVLHEVKPHTMVVYNMHDIDLSVFFDNNGDHTFVVGIRDI